MSRSQVSARESDGAGMIAGSPFRLAYRLGEVAVALGLSRRTIERERSAGRFPAPDLKIGKPPLWTKETLTKWIERGLRK